MVYIYSEALPDIQCVDFVCVTIKEVMMSLQHTQQLFLNQTLAVKRRELQLQTQEEQYKVRICGGVFTVHDNNCTFTLRCFSHLWLEMKTIHSYWWWLIIVYIPPCGLPYKWPNHWDSTESTATSQQEGCEFEFQICDATIACSTCACMAFLIAPCLPKVLYTPILH